MAVLGGLTFHYVDARSLFYEYRDVFQQEIYRFTADTPAPFVIDAGGYIGVSTLYFKQLYPEATVVTFEPVPEICACLEKNIACNAVSGVSVVHAGLGSSARTEQLFPDGADGGSVCVQSGAPPIDIRLETLSTRIDRRVDLLKMNIEGMESEVFPEIEPKLSLVNEIIFEYHAFSSLPQSLGSILQLLDRNGFRYVVSELAHTPVTVPVDFAADYRYFNIVYARRTAA